MARYIIGRLLLIATTVFTAVATSCVKEVTLDAMEEPTVVVECILSDVPVQTLYLTYTKGASREEAQDLPEAKAVLTDLTEAKEAGRFSRAVDGSWTLDYAAVPEHRYRLDVELPGHEPIWAEQTMPEKPRVYDLPINTNRQNVKGDLLKDSGVFFKIGSLNDPLWFYGINHPTLDSGGELTPTLCTDYPYVDTFNITEMLYSHATTERSFWGGTWFRTSTYIDLDGKPLHKRALRFPARKNIQTVDCLISGSFQGYISSIKDFVHAVRRPAELHYFSASEDYDRFLQDAYNMMDLKASTNLADIFIRENAYTNIQGEAIGIFGCRIERSLAWEGTEPWGASGEVFFADFLSDLLPSYNIPDSGYNSVILVSAVRVQTGEWWPVPFELLHFEVWSSEKPGNTPLSQPPDWAPNEGESRVKMKDLLIQDEEQLEKCGLDGIGPIDFSKKAVLYIAHLGDFLPVGIAYNTVIDSDSSWYDDYFNNVPRLELIQTPMTAIAFRIALLIDKEHIPAIPVVNRHPGHGDYWYVGWDGFCLSKAVSVAEDLSWNLP